MTLRILTLLVVWVALFRRVTPGVVVSGLAVAAFASWLVPGESAPAPRLRPLGRLLAHQTAAIVRATIDVARWVVVPGATTNPGTVEVVLAGATERQAVWVATLTTMTPGTFVVDVIDGPALVVHGLDVSDRDSLRAEVVELHVLVAAAIRDHPDANPVPGDPSLIRSVP